MTELIIHINVYPDNGVSFCLNDIVSAIKQIENVQSVEVLRIKSNDPENDGFCTPEEKKKPLGVLINYEGDPPLGLIVPPGEHDPRCG